jgi:(E)-4-hydroxy-3-methylbut-2-enyl-diphosphate synthase
MRPFLIRMNQNIMIDRKKTKKVMVGKVPIGGNSKITVQSMCNTFTKDVKSTLDQIHDLEKAGCDIIRVTVPDEESAASLKDIKENISIPLVADIHFDYRLALKSAPYVDKLRINPGNIGDIKNVKSVVSACNEYSLPIRIGVNSGSIEKELIQKYGRSPQAMVESAMKHVKILEDLDFHDIILSIKSSNVLETINSYQLISEKTDYPLHVGVTEAGTSFAGTIKSSVGLGSLLSKGIGDTIRVSLTDEPIEEVRVGIEVLKSLGLRQGRQIISCPTCGRTEIDIIRLAKEIEKKTEWIKEPITIAVMGCVVNGPGEASHADYGIAGGKGVGLLFKGGKTLKKVPEKQIVDELMKLIENDIGKS